MDNEKTFEEKLEEITAVKVGYDLEPELVSAESLAQLTKAHELKYIENILEVEEENKLAYDNIDDFLEYPAEVQKEAIEAYAKAKNDPEYFSREGVNQGLYKPVLILTNIDNKKNEAKIKTWKVEYHSRLIKKLQEFRQYSGVKEGGFLSKIFS